LFRGLVGSEMCIRDSDTTIRATKAKEAREAHH
jgi:hypothetical protein